MSQKENKNHTLVKDTQAHEEMCATAELPQTAGERDNRKLRSCANFKEAQIDNDHPRELPTVFNLAVQR